MFLVLVGVWVTLLVLNLAEGAARVEGMLMMVLPALVAEAAARRIQHRKIRSVVAKLREQTPEESSALGSEEPTIPGKPRSPKN